jgi:hypothetical protein
MLRARMSVLAWPGRIAPVAALLGGAHGASVDE